MTQAMLGLLDIALLSMSATLFLLCGASLETEHRDLAGIFASLGSVTSALVLVTP